MKFFSSESVTEGHPDKVCDQISDAILDEILKQDPMAHVAIETTASTGIIHIMGEVTASAVFDTQGIARRVINEIGYDGADKSFDGNTCGIITSINGQSPDIAMGVDDSLESKSGEEDEISKIGAGDQGMMFGYACDETRELMPLSISLSHKIVKRLAKVRKDGTLPYLFPDGKTLVTVQYGDSGQVERIEAIVLSAQHSANVSQETLRRDIKDKVILPTVPKELIDENTKFFINATGRFVLGGPAGDTGLTGRKIIADTYGGWGHHGGGSFSGKDPTKVDRSAAYAARWAAKNIVAASLASRCEVQIAYAIGKSRPLSVCVDTFGTGMVPDDLIAKAVEQVFDFRPGAIIRDLNLRRPIYRPLAAYGQIGREDVESPWELTNRVAALLDAVERLR